MKKRLIAATIAAVALLGASNAQAQCDAGETVIKFSLVININTHPKGVTSTLLAKRVNDEMQGKACMKLFANSTLFNDDKVLEALLNGDVQLAAPSLSKFEKFTKQFRIFDLPFMFKNIDAVNAFQASADGQAMKDSMRRRGLQGLVFWHNGMKHMSANKPLIMPTDAQGLKIRVQSSEVIVEQMKALGASPQKMAYSEVYGALQQGVVDGQENTWSNIYSSKFFEVQDSITETNHGLLDYLVVTSVDWLEGLEPDVRDQFLAILDEVTQLRNHEAFEINQNDRQSILAAGGTIHTLDETQRQAWIDVMKKVWVKFTPDIGQDKIDAVQAINARF